MNQDVCRGLSSYFLHNIYYVPILGLPKFSSANLQKASPTKLSVPSISFRMNNAIIEVTKNYAIASFKPHLNYHECYLSLVVTNKLSLPLKVYPIRLFVGFC